MPRFIVDIGRVVVSSDTETPATVQRRMAEAVRGLVVEGITFDSEATVVVYPVTREVRAEG